jgi:hypothetical protein
MTKFRAGLVVGFAGGYYLGARAGRHRYEQLNAVLERVGRSRAVPRALRKARAVVDLGRERAHTHARHEEPVLDLTGQFSNN